MVKAPNVCAPVSDSAPTLGTESHMDSTISWGKPMDVSFVPTSE